MVRFLGQLVKSRFLKTPARVAIPGYGELKKGSQQSFSYKGNAAVDGAPNFASRWMTKFRSSHAEFAPPS
jgi:hypothetical protein